MKTARQVAVQALLRVDLENGYSNLVLDAELEKSALTPRDAAFASALFYGTLERRITLDHCIARYSRQPLSKLSFPVLEILRTGFYQLLYLDRIPDSAAVNESVKLCTLFQKKSAGGFVNALLRSFLRDEKKIHLSADPIRRLSVLYSVPPALVKLLQTQYGEETEPILKASLGRPPVYLRVNTLKTTLPLLQQALKEEGTETILDEQVNTALKLYQGDPTRLKAFERGEFFVQDKASQLCTQALSPKPGERIADFCAAPGGKSFSIALLMENRGEVLSCDQYESRVGLIAKSAERLSLSCIRPMTNDALCFREELGQFDRVLCDVPCSGLGILRRKPEIKYKKTEDENPLFETQLGILKTCSRYVKPGGICVYSTCSVDKRENEQVIKAFLEQNPEFVLDPLPESFSFSGQREQAMITLLPQQWDSDGFFICRMKRQEVR